MREHRPGLIAVLAAFLALVGQIGFGVLPAQAMPALDGLGHVHICGTAQPGHAPDAPAHKATCAACVLCAASLVQATLPLDTPEVPAPRGTAVIRPPYLVESAPPPEHRRAAQPRGPPA